MTKYTRIEGICRSLLLINNWNRGRQIVLDGDRIPMDILTRCRKSNFVFGLVSKKILNYTKPKINVRNCTEGLAPAFL